MITREGVFVGRFQINLKMMDESLLLTQVNNEDPGSYYR